MADLLTVDTDPNTETVPDSLTTNELESLEIGEKLVEEQEQLLAGKYKNAEELEKAYKELQTKLGTNESTEDTEETTESEEPSEEEPSADEPSASVSLISDASQEFSEKGELTPETMAKFSEMSSADLVNAYMEIQAQVPDGQPQEVSDLTDSDVNVIKNHAGGEESYNQMVDWAQSNLDKSSIQAFDNLINSGDVETIKFAVSGLKAQFENSNGYEGRMLSGKAPKTSGDIFRSQAEVVAAMSDPRYDNDPAYRMDIVEKLDRSDLQF